MELELLEDRNADLEELLPTSTSDLPAIRSGIAENDRWRIGDLIDALVQNDKHTETAEIIRSLALPMMTPAHTCRSRWGFRSAGRRDRAGDGYVL